ncbi:unnamed protein product [Orchesella dallaii]|uniref:C2H2-type domain-containing protein n=1 Tax=Orchesella dallaii TaxID=48710 RepID=A0ABP1RZ97_9HEXA
MSTFQIFKMSTEKEKNFIFLNTDGICLLCYDDCPKSVEKEKNSMQTSINFCKLISRYLGFNLENVVETPVKSLRKCKKPDKIGIELCERCFQLALAFCNVHFQLQFHQMVLDRCIRTISEIIRESETKAKGALFTMCKDENSLMQQKKFTRLAVGNLKSANNLRNKLQQRCSVKLKTSVPIVKLKDLFGENPPKSKLKNISTDNESQILIPSLRGCIISFWIVLSLSFINPDEIGSDQKGKKRKKAISPPVVQPSSHQPEVQSSGSQSSAQAKIKDSVEVTPVKSNSTVKSDLAPTFVQPTNPVQHSYPYTPQTSTTFQQYAQPNPTFPSTPSYPYTNTWNSYNYTNYNNNGYNYNYPNYSNTYQGLWPSYSAPANLPCTSSSSTYIPPTYNDLNQHDDANTYGYDNMGRIDQHQPFNGFAEHTGYYTPPSQNTQGSQQYHQLTTPQQQTGHQGHVTLAHSDSSQAQPNPLMGENVYSPETTPMDMDISTSSSSSEEPNLSHHTAISDESQLEPEEHDAHQSANPNAASPSSKQVNIIGPALFPEIRGKQKGKRLQANIFCIHHGCTETFLTKGQLELHLKSHGTFKCNHCHLTFGKAHTLALHEKQRHSPPGQTFSRLIHPCTRCDFTFPSQNKFFLHFFNDHLNISVYDRHCLVCRKQYVVGTTSQTMQAHYKNSHDVMGRDVSEIFTCSDCKAPFLTSQQLKVHRAHKVCKQTIANL